MADEELQIEEEGGKKSKLMLIIIIVVVLLGGGAAAYFFLFAGDDEPAAEQLAEGEGGEVAAEEAESTSSGSAGSAEMGSALYVAIPQPITFHIPGSGRERTVQIKIQLLVRGSENEEAAKVNIPLIQGTLLKVFSSSNADDLVTEAGKIELREKALEEVQNAMKKFTGSEVVEQVLFTGFVMQ